jgi:hypothetical protein
MGCQPGSNARAQSLPTQGRGQKAYGWVLRQISGRNLATEMKRARLWTSVLGYRPDFSRPLR